MFRERSQERALIRKALAGDRDAAERLVARHYSGVLRFLLHLTGEMNEAEELAQETFVRAWTNLGGFEGRASLRTWLHRIAYREYSVRRHLPGFVELPDEVGDERQNFLGPLVEALAVERAIATLPEQLRITFILCEVQEMSAREAADVLGVPLGTVLSRIHTARERLRKQLVMNQIVSGVPAMEPSVRGVEGPQTHEMSKAIL